MKGLKSTLTVALTLGLLAGGTLAVAAQETTPTMSQFSGRLVCSGPVSSSEAAAYGFSVEDISDERFAGDHISHLTGYEDGDPDGDGIGAYAALWEVTGADGGWVGDYTTFRFAPESYSTMTVALEGRGTYEGLTALMEADFTDDCGWDVRGVVVDGELPATPVAVTTTE